ncbi:hypothetical protein [Sessilibacter corallicola]|uniref:hypothetical protein n=1 Tax=Sessilibacter corallicola TaxID=2904075 RepID=UPI001E2984E9|nr:hypothetical protein [Sessilibacter corallicola]MCE2027063.1 hypothetical protein [Sessilibacter corallicola]
MNNPVVTHRLLILLLLVLTSFSPALFSWVLSEQGTWYRPFIVWSFVILIAYLLQRERIRRDF